MAEKTSASQPTQDRLVTQLTKASQDLQSALQSNSVEDAIAASNKVEDLQKAIRSLGEATKAPGTTDVLANKISDLVSREAWSGSEDIMKEVNRVMKRLPDLKTVADLQKEMTTISNNTASKLPFGMQDPVSRAGSMLKSLFRDAETDAVARSIGSEEGVDALQQFNQNRQRFASVARLKDALDDRLGIGGSTSGYAKGIRGMAQSEGEKVFRRLSGKGDADVLNLLQVNFPETANAVRDAHVDQLMSKAVRAAKGDNLLNTTTLSKSMQSLSPEIRNFIAPGVIQGKLDAVDQILTKLNDPNHNFSNTARTAEKLLGHIPGSAVAAATMLMGHNPAIGLVLGSLTKMVSKDAPDAVRLSLLKFLGSDRAIEPGAFKSMADFIRSTMKGESLIAKGSKALFVAGREVLPETQFPTQKDRDKLTKRLDEIQKDPTQLEDVGGNLGHYLPNHGQALAQTAVNAANYLNSLKPSQTKSNPLDSKPVLSSTQKASYNRALDIAIQPMVVASAVKQGRVVPSDVQHLANLYPALYNNLRMQFSKEMINAVDKGQTIPYTTRLGLSMFLGQPLDSTMTSGAIISAQPVPTPTTSAQNAMPGRTKRGTTNLGKMSSMYQTPGQAREANRTKE